MARLLEHIGVALSGKPGSFQALPEPVEDFDVLSLFLGVYEGNPRESNVWQRQYAAVCACASGVSLLPRIASDYGRCGNEGQGACGAL